MKTRLLTVFLAIALVSELALATGVVFADTPCDSAHVTRSGNVITVSPTGIADTENIQCAFDTAVATGPGVDVQLNTGTFHTAQIVVNDFYGNFYGAGSQYTTVVNLPNLYVTPMDWVYNQPSASNPCPNLFSFIGGDFAITDLMIKIVGDDLTTGWTIFGIDPPFEELANAIMITGTNANVRVERFMLEGEKMENSTFGYNVLNGIYYEGNVGEVPPPLSGSYTLANSIIRTTAFGTPVYNLTNASVLISGNSYDDTFIAADVGGLQNATYEFSHNKIVNTVVGFDVWDAFGPYIDSSFLARNNVFNSAIGVAFEMTFGVGNQCLITGNNVANVTDLGIFLGPETRGCTVVGGSSKTNVLDLGTNNVLVGVNNMGIGIGPEIQTFMKTLK